MLVLVLVLIVAFLSSVSVELQSAKQYSSGADARTLADSAVSLVISQIQDATASPQLAWASQPGMIRTFSADGNLDTAYKLYSASRLRAGPEYDPSADVPPNWASSTTLYTDMNKPVAVSGTNHFPIIDPSAVAIDVSGGGALLGSEPPIEGCFLDTTNPAAATSVTQPNPVPLPVQWIYVLNSGSLVAMDPATSKISGATKEDPIVGRIAFWTDDESSKVNINTASEGTFWDRPWTDGANTGYEKMLSSASPVQNEFQRYPGHPAMTSLSVIFPPLDGETAVQYSNRIADIIPRVTYKDSTGSLGGSQAGTAPVTETSKPLLPDTDRLFASVDELYFGLSGSSTRPANLKGQHINFNEADLERTRFFLTANSRAPEVNMFNKPRITLWPLQANTGAIDDPVNAPDRNAKDKLIAFCSTIGGVPYYFQRYNTFDSAKVRSSGAPYNPAALQSPIPSSQSPSMDWTNIPRNQAIFAYLQALIRKPIPGLGGTLVGPTDKYSDAVGDQILTEMMDYVRSYINTFRSKPANAVSTDAPYYSYAPISQNAAGNASGWVTGQGQVVPLVITPPGASYKTKGFGRFSTITQASLVFYRTDKLQYVPNPAAATDVPTDLPDTASVTGKITVLDYTPGTPITISPFVPTYSPPDSPFVTSGGAPIPLRTPKMRAVLLLQTLNTSPGMPPWTGNFRCRIKGLDSLQVKMGSTATSLGFPADASNLVNGNSEARYHTNTALNAFELNTDYWPANRKTLGVAVPGSAAEEAVYPFYSDEIPLTTATFDIIGGDITVEIYSGYSSPNGINASDLVQTIHMAIPSTSTGDVGLPSPNIVFGANFSGTTGVTTIKSENGYSDYNARLAHPGYNSTGAPHHLRPYVRQPGGNGPRGDTVRSVQARYGFSGGGGDYRIISGLAEVPASFFEGHGLTDPATDNLTYNTTTIAAKALHSLRSYPATGNNDDPSNGFYASQNNTTGLTYLSPVKSHAKLVNGAAYLDPMNSGGARPSTAPLAAQGMKGAFMDSAGSIKGDWDTGPAKQIDGPYINKADEATSNIGWYVGGSYENAGSIVETGASFSPNRQVSSAVTFGSLPSGIDPSDPSKSIPWRTLLFCKNPAAGSQHPGFGKNSGNTLAPPYSTAPDHAFLDLFTMPIVEPYAISEPFSTAGKVNMNYQIVPFTYLTRSTAVRAVLKSTNLMAIPTTDGRNYKSGTSVDFPLTMPPDYRYTLNLEEQGGTLEGFERRFNPKKFGLGGTADIFRSASEICDIFLVPKNLVNSTVSAPGNPTYSTMGSWWGNYELTGDNVRESPYGHIYPRLTTKSNTFTVHVQAQSIAKANGTPADEFIEEKDKVTGEYRGAFLLERYLDPNSDSLVDSQGKPASETDADSMVGPYKFRVISSKRIAP
jgi:uncharacterized protein (TIGR02600 family)